MHHFKDLLRRRAVKGIFSDELDVDIGLFNPKTSCKRAINIYGKALWLDDLVKLIKKRLNISLGCLMLSNALFFEVNYLFCQAILDLSLSQKRILFLTLHLVLAE